MTLNFINSFMIVSAYQSNRNEVPPIFMTSMVRNQCSWRETGRKMENNNNKRIIIFVVRLAHPIGWRFLNAHTAVRKKYVFLQFRFVAAFYNTRYIHNASKFGMKCCTALARTQFPCSVSVCFSFVSLLYFVWAYPHHQFAYSNIHKNSLKYFKF